MGESTGGRCWGPISDMSIPPHVSGQIHKIIVQPAMLYEMEAVPMASSHVKKLEGTYL